MSRSSVLCVALLGALCVAPAHADQSVATLAKQMAGRWRLAPAGSAAGLRGLVTLRVQGRAGLAGTFAPPGRRAVPLHSVRLRFEHLSFAFSPGPGTRTVTADLHPTLDADTWNGRLRPTGVVVDLTRQAP